MLPDPAALAALLPAGARLDRAAQIVLHPVNPSRGQGSVTVPVPDGYYWWPLHISATLITSDVVYTRTPYFALDDNEAHIIFTAHVAAGVPENQNLLIGWDAIDSAGFNLTGQQVTGPLPPVIGLPGWTYMIEVDTADVNDRLAAITMVVLQIPSGPQVESVPRTLDTRHLIQP